MKQKRKTTVAARQRITNSMHEVVLQKSEEFEGPIPSPSSLEAYALIDASFPERILQLTEKEQAFRHQLTQKAVHDTLRILSKGQCFAFILCCFILVIALFLVLNGHPAPATIITTLDLVGVAAAFHFTQKSDSKKN